MKAINDSDVNAPRLFDLPPKEVAPPDISTKAVSRRKTAKLPTSATAFRFCGIMRRKTTTKWNDREIRLFRNLLPIDEDDLATAERYYKAHWPPRRDRNILRHDLATLLYNWAGEVDRARIWCEAHPIKPPPRKIIPLPPPPESVITDVERAQASDEFEKLMGRKPTWAQ